MEVKRKQQEKVEQEERVKLAVRKSRDLLYRIILFSRKWFPLLLARKKVWHQLPSLNPPSPPPPP